MKINFTTKTVANFRSQSDLKIIITTLGKGVEVIGQPLERNTMRIKGVPYDFILCEVPSLGLSGYIAFNLLVKSEDYLTPLLMREPHYIGKNRPKSPNEFSAKVQPLMPLNLPKEISYQEKFERIAKFLNVEKSSAFLPTTKDTFCNVAAYQFAYQLGVYIPRVFWISESDEKRGVVEYGKTVKEMSANSIYNWFLKRGKDFGWRSVSEAEAIECAKTQPTVAIIARKGSGHIAMIRPNGNTWEAGRENNEDNPRWRRWFYHTRLNFGAMFWTHD